MKRAVFFLGLALVAGCAGMRPSPERWSAPTSTFYETWNDRARVTQTMAFLASAEFESHSEHHSFTLELFYRDPDVYALRGRGFLGATGFRARIHGDSLVVLLTREKRGYAGPIEGYPDSSVADMWALMRLALPWLAGENNLDKEPQSKWQVRLTRAGTAPEDIYVQDDGKSLRLYYGRQRAKYPYWHLMRAVGSSQDGRLSLVMRQRLHNPELDRSHFELTLPAGTRPLID